MIEIDGSYGEGGGQILRMSIAMAAVTGKEVRVFNIRGGRPKPGLKRQHMVAIESVARLCHAEVEGLQLGSTEIEFYPGALEGGEYHFDIGTAGSVTLVLQACIPPSLKAERETHLVLRGGTDVKWSPPWDYFQHVTIPLLRKMGCSVEGYLNRRGYYPTGGGEVEVFIQPCHRIRTIQFNDRIESIFGLVHSANLPPHVPQRIKRAAEEELSAHDLEAHIVLEETTAACPGTGITLWTEGKVLGADALGERGTPAEQVGRKAAEMLATEIAAGVDVDERMVDQILPYAALANGTLSFTCRKVSEHARTEMWLIGQFADVQFEVISDGMQRVTVKGVGT